MIHQDIKRCVLLDCNYDCTLVLIIILLYSQNILIDSHGTGKIGDFGFSIQLPKVAGGRSMFTAQCFARSEGYYPTELSCGQYGPRSDVYSFGVVSIMLIYVTLHGKTNHIAHKIIFELRLITIGDLFGSYLRLSPSAIWVWVYIPKQDFMYYMIGCLGSIHWPKSLL